MSAWRATLETLVRERGRALFGYAYVLTGDRHDAEDLLQDALVRAFRSGRRASTLDAAHVYVKKAIATAFIDRARRSAVRPHVVGELTEFAQPATASGALEDGVHDVIDLQTALLALGPRARACIVLRYMEDLRVDEIAGALGIAPGTVKRYLSDAILRLRADLPALDFGEGDLVDVRITEGGES
jgi:RNA polymerase sigma-70 factor (ECF subfamily)